MEASGLQRSTTSFRRQGSSGLVWNDRFLSGDLNRMKQLNDLNNKENRGSDGMNTIRRSRSDGDGAHVYRTMNAVKPSVDPPSPKVSGCGLCGVFSNPDAAKKRRSNQRK